MYACKQTNKKKVKRVLNIFLSHKKTENLLSYGKNLQVYTYE